MAYKSLHFLYSDHKPEAAELAKKFIAAFGQSDIEKADAVISIGGDGQLLESLSKAQGRPVYGITPAASNSNGFWTDHDVETPAKLIENLNRTAPFKLQPLKAEITFANGEKILCRAFNDVAIAPDSGQAVLMNLKAEFNGHEIGPYRLMGDGLVFSTALGSTGTNHSYNGPLADIRNTVILITGKGIRGLSSFTADGKTSSFSIDFGSVAHKRPVRVDYDGHSISAKSGHDSPISHIAVSLDPQAEATLLVTQDPAQKTFAALIPGAR